jgi:tetratricopeptide (TPR) repeat protein
MSKQSTGIGATVDPSPLGGFVVKAVTDTGSAKKAGILVADRITTVDGHSVVESSVEKLRSLLLGPPSSPIEVKIIRGDQSLTLKFNRNPPLNAAAALPASTSSPTPVAVAAPSAAAAPSPPLPSTSHTNDLQLQQQQQQQQQQQPQQQQQQQQQLEAASRSKVLGNSAFSAGKFEEAVEHFTAAISLEPSNHVHYSNRSVSYAKLGKAHAALSDANKCTRLCPSFSKGWFRLGVANDMLGRYSDAVAALEQGLKIEPGHQQMEAALSRARSLVSSAAAGAAQAATADDNGGDNVQQQLQRLEEPLIAYVKEGGGGASARRLQEEEEWLAKLGISFKNEQERSKVLAAAKVQRELDSMSLESEVAAAEHFEWKRSRTEAAKFLAVKQHMDYDGFKNLVDGATLTSIKPQQGEDIHSITAEKRHIVFNKEAVGAKGSVSGEDGQDALTLGVGRAVKSGKELEKLWRRCNGKADEQWSLLACIDPAAFPSVFLQEQDASLVDGIVASCATALAQASNIDRVCLLLQHLVKSKRFKLTWAMVDGSTKAHARHIVSTLQPTHALEAEALDAALLKA